MGPGTKTIMRIIWDDTDADAHDNIPIIYYAKRAIEEYGNALRDNSIGELVEIGKRVELIIEGDENV